MTSFQAARRAEALAGTFPPLLVAAQRVAATVLQGVHGRRRPGSGDAFWQFRPFVPGDLTSRIDWRQSAKSDRAYVREREWAAAQTVFLWRDASASMRWRSPLAQEEKRTRAELLLLALAALLHRGGERVQLLGAPQKQAPAASSLEWLAELLAEGVAGEDDVLLSAPLPRHARVVLIGDFLAPLEDIKTILTRLAGIPVTGHVLQVLDPAEMLLPYEGRVQFVGLEKEGEILVSRAEHLREAYGRRLRAQIDGLFELCAAAQMTVSVHRTSEPPQAALLGLYMALVGH
jgi:uncharacterized protein (DUF58 family)